MTSKNIIPQKHSISKKDRSKLTGNKPIVIWFTGLSGSGKSTLVNVLEQRLFKRRILTYILDGDNIRMGLNKDLGFSDIDRKENIRRVSEAAKLLTDAGVVVLTAFISPFREDRLNARKLFGVNEFIEVYVKCPIEICRERDVKGLYKKAKEGKIENFTGIDSDYEEPENPELIVDTSIMSVDEAVNVIEKFIELKLIEQN
ncbi:MAG: putative adenylyl-sulfate kinase [Ignavibacteria bacterium]|nr:putative adenylyl-sulfate kinase [Ignavibacteria bacterium]